MACPKTEEEEEEEEEEDKDKDEDEDDEGKYSERGGRSWRVAVWGPKHRAW